MAEFSFMMAFLITPITLNEPVLAQHPNYEKYPAIEIVTFEVFRNLYVST
jgi:hypothetical protein